MVKTLADYARLKSLGDKAVALQPPAIKPDFQYPRFTHLVRGTRGRNNGFSEEIARIHLMVRPQAYDYRLDQLQPTGMDYRLYRDTRRDVGPRDGIQQQRDLC